MKKLLKFKEWYNKLCEGIPNANAKNTVLDKLKELFNLKGLENDTSLTSKKFSELNVNDPKGKVINSALYTVNANPQQKQALEGMSPVDTTIQDVLDIMAN
jgi:hypothetical protein